MQEGGRKDAERGKEDAGKCQKNSKENNRD